MYEQMAMLEGEHWWFEGRRAVVRDLLRRFAPQKGRLLDIGLGTGFNAHIMSGLGYEVHGVEPADEAIAYAKKIAPEVGVIQAPFPSDRVPSSAYDVVLLLDVLEHLEDDRAALVDVKRVLKPGGVALVTVPAFMFLWTQHDEQAHHFRRYTRGQLKRVIESAGLEPVKVSYYNSFLFPAIAGVRLISKALGLGQGKSDLDKTPRAVNGILSHIFSSERIALRYCTFPAGVSLVAVIRNR